MTAIAAEAAVADSQRSMTCGLGKVSCFIRAQFKGSGEEQWTAEKSIMPNVNSNGQIQFRRRSDSGSIQRSQFAKSQGDCVAIVTEGWVVSSDTEINRGRLL
jgi:hypothetical protein